MSSFFKNAIRAVLPWKVYWGLKRFREESRAYLSTGDLSRLAEIYKTDKGWKHNYMPVYLQWFASLRHKPIRLLEIGVGGYDKPHLGGDSLRMWKSYFRKGVITGIDIHEKSALSEDRIRIYQGDQSDKNFLREVSEKEGPFDIIIDDGSHLQSHIITSFETLFPLMKPGGIYVIEDSQTSYRSSYEGSTSEMDTVQSAMNYFIQRVHHVNKTVWVKEDLKRELPQDDIGAIAFYHNLIFVKKI